MIVPNKGLVEVVVTRPGRPHAKLRPNHYISSFRRNASSSRPLQRVSEAFGKRRVRDIWNSINRQKRASVLVGLLWCLTLLSVVVIGVLYTARLDLKVAKNYGDNIQAYYLAIAGVEKAKALIYDDAASRKRSAQNHSGALYNDPDDFRDVHFGRGEFRVIRQGDADEGGRLIYGISDEESRLNVNQASGEELLKLYGMTPEVSAAIGDWRDQDNNVSQGGAESEYYAAMRPPYIARNDRIQTARELLMVKGITSGLLLGEDANANGLLDPEENDGDLSYPPDNRDGILDAGWSSVLCFESKVQNKSAAGQDRIDVQKADEAALTGVPGITSEIAKAIVAYRDQNKIETLDKLLDVQAMRQPEGQSARPTPQGGPNGQPGENPQQNQQRAQPVGPKLISEDLLMQVADDLTTTSDGPQGGAINVNTASYNVLLCLQGMTEELARAIISYRSSAGFLPNVAHLLKVPGMTREIFQRIAPKVTARSETFRIISEGKVASTGARKRLEVIVQLGRSSIDTISYRENL
jgi:competence ComEA-like helix-hairpin-helix protein